MGAASSECSKQWVQQAVGAAAVGAAAVGAASRTHWRCPAACSAGSLEMPYGVQCGAHWRCPAACSAGPLNSQIAMHCLLIRMKID